MHIYTTSDKAKEDGWVPTDKGRNDLQVTQPAYISGMPFGLVMIQVPIDNISDRKVGEFYTFEASRKIGVIRYVAQAIFVKFLKLTTCGRALHNERIQRWQNEVHDRSVTRTIYYRELHILE